MKIGILTQPIHINYGGTLQAYALQKVLRDMGHEAWLVRLEPYLKHNLDYWVRTNIGNIIRYFRHQELRRWTWLKPVPKPSRDVVEKNIQNFVTKWINPKTEYIYGTKSLRQDFLKHKYDVYVIGSDQVWRPLYNGTNQANYWLDFLGNNSATLRISYAASLGTDQWEYKGELQRKCCKLAHRFNSLSVREASGVRLLSEKFGLKDVEHVLDPTLLLNRSDYEKLLGSDLVPTDKVIFSYLLDFKDENIRLIDEISSSKNLPVKAIRPKKKSVDYIEGDDDADYVIPPVEEWLKSFIDADYVITDSFHGTVFSIIFNKPFVTLCNSVRGNTRLESLLGLFDMKDRLTSSNSKDEVEKILDKPIDWAEINRKRDELKIASINFLISSLKK